MVVVESQLELVSRSYVEKILDIRGEGSAADLALKRADEHEGEVEFYIAKGKGQYSILVKPI